MCSLVEDYILIVNSLAPSGPLPGMFPTLNTKFDTKFDPEPFL